VDATTPVEETGSTSTPTTETALAVVDQATGEVRRDMVAVPIEAAAVAHIDPERRYVQPGTVPVDDRQMELLLSPVNDGDVEIRPDGLVYLPEIKYRRILNRTFRPGGWAIMPIEIRYDPKDKMMYYRGALFVAGTFVAETIGEQRYFEGNDQMSYATAAEAAKSNCMMRCCKDLGIASELWDPQYIQTWLATYATEVWCVNIGSRDRGKKKKMWRKKGAPPIDQYPWKEEGGQQGGGDGPARVRVEEAYQPSPGEDIPVAQAVDDHPFIQGLETQVGAERAESSRPARKASATPSTAGTAGRPTSSPLPSSASASGEEPVITPKQAGRFLAIKEANGWSWRALELFMVSCGYSWSNKPKEAVGRIKRRHYEKMCAALEDVEIHTTYEQRAQERHDAQHGNQEADQ
jgi:hypothetical protein